MKQFNLNNTVALPAYHMHTPIKGGLFESAFTAGEPAIIGDLYFFRLRTFEITEIIHTRRNNQDYGQDMDERGEIIPVFNRVKSKLVVTVKS